MSTTPGNRDGQDPYAPGTGSEVQRTESQRSGPHRSERLRAQSRAERALLAEGEDSTPMTDGGARRARGRRSIPGLVDMLRGDPELRDRFVHWHRTAARPGRVAEFPESLHPRLREVLRTKGIEAPYEHQCRGIEAALAGEDVLITTPTASGKTLCYTVPVVQRLLESDGRSKAIFLFPTKALSQDQSAGLSSLIEALDAPWHAHTYDGDTPPTVRRTLRQRGHVILTNPWMLHSGILPNHAKWSELFRDLRTIVIDEVHTLSGVFGSHVANVLRRLIRIAAHYGSRPNFVLSSATIPDAAGHGRRLLGREVTTVEEDASPMGERVFGLYNPPMLDPVAGLRANALEEARRLARRLCGSSHQTIIFCNRRTSVEVLTRYLKESAASMGLRPDEIRGYRGGYLPLLRREIEGDLREGRVRVVISTNALELGIDLGRLDVAILVGYPGSQASFWQRAGRVGRRGGMSLVVQIARSEPVDQYLTHHPDRLFSKPSERLGLDPDNLVILSEELKCAAFELPFRRAELEDPETPFGGVPHTADVLDYFAHDSGMLHPRGDTWYWTADAYPAEQVSLIGNEPDNVVILDIESKRAIGEIDREGSLTTVHEGAIYQVEGETWIVERFDYENRRAYVREVESDYFTDAVTDTEVRVDRLERRLLRTRAEAPVADPFVLPGPDGSPPPPLPRVGEDYAVWSGEVHVKTLAKYYKKIRFYTRENVGAEDITLPPEELDTQGFVLTLSEDTASELGLRVGDRSASWRAVGELVRRVAPLYLRCQPQDLGLSAQVKSKHFARPSLFLFDRIQGGVGLSDLLFEGHRDILSAALEVVRRCECVSGCPACAGPVAEVGPDGKATALRVLSHLVEGPSPVPAEVDSEAEGFDPGDGHSSLLEAGEQEPGRGFDAP